MTAILDTLIDLLNPQPTGPDRFVAPSQDLGWGAIFGGQVLGQALAAAEQTVPADRVAHSLHAYFLRRGDPKLRVHFEVDRIRDGRSFNTRRVVVRQGVTDTDPGRAIFNLSCSFQQEETGFEHHEPAPWAPRPEQLEPEQVHMKRVLASLPPALLKRATGERAIQLHPVEPGDPMKPSVRLPRKLVWMKAADRLPDDPSVHKRLLAYASDFHLLTTSLHPHGVSWLTPGMQVASLDHALWFHRPFRMDEWLLYAMQSPAAAGARGLAQGRFYNQAGDLVASTMQEGLIRQRGPSPKG